MFGANMNAVLPCTHGPPRPSLLAQETESELKWLFRPELENSSRGLKFRLELWSPALTPYPT